MKVSSNYRRCRSCGDLRALVDFPVYRLHGKPQVGYTCVVCKNERDRAYARRMESEMHGLFGVLISMRCRCNIVNDKSYPRYGARGIRICDEWTRDPKAFYRWGIEHGYKPGLQIDRIDNAKGYSPENCRFVTPAENSGNRSTTKLDWDSVKAIRAMVAAGAHSQRQIARMFGICQQTVFDVASRRRWRD